MQTNVSNPAQNEKIVEQSNYYSKGSNFMIDLYFLEVNFTVGHYLNGNGGRSGSLISKKWEVESLEICM